MVAKIDRPKLLAIASFLFAIPAGYYFLAGNALQAIVFVLLSDLFDRMAVRQQKQNKSEGGKLFIKMAIDRCTDAAIFVGFALSGIVPRDYGIALLIAAVLVPFWVQTLWKRNVRWVFHAVVYIYAIASIF